MRAINECRVDGVAGLPDNNQARGATTQALKGIRSDLQFHTSYHILDENGMATGVVPDGKSVPEGAFDIRSYDEGQVMSKPGKCQDGITRQNVHTHGKEDGADGGVPFEYKEVNP